MAVLLSACGSGTDGEGGAGMGAGGTGGATMCGNGVVDAMLGEQCDPPGGAVTQTCASLNMGTGMITCSSTCQLVLMCSPGGGTGGTGAGGAGGR